MSARRPGGAGWRHARGKQKRGQRQPLRAGIAGGADDACGNAGVEHRGAAGVGILEADHRGIEQKMPAGVIAIGLRA